MTKHDEGKRQITEALLESVEGGATAIQIADMVATSLMAITRSLSLIIGKGGVAALYRRSVDLTQSTYPWLAGCQTSRSEVETSSLRDLLSGRNADEAAEAGGALLQQLRDLLASLIGAALSERLLRSAWETVLNFHHKQDLSS